MSFFDQIRNKSEKLYMDEYNAIMQRQGNLFRIVSEVELLSKFYLFAPCILSFIGLYQIKGVITELECFTT